MCIPKVGGITVISVAIEIKTKETLIHIRENMTNQKTVVMNVRNVGKK